MKCTNCNHPNLESYCAHCGQPAQVKRIDAHYVLHEIEHVLHLEKGIFFTVKALIISPGQTVRQFLSENRSRLVKPILFIILTSLIYTVVAHVFHFEDGYISYQNTKRNATTVVFEWIQHHYGYANILEGIFIASWLKLFFRRYQYNFFELLILLCFVMGIAMLMLGVFAIIEGVTKIHLLTVGSAVAMVYTVWATGQFFDKRKPGSYIKACIAYLLGVLCFALAAVILGMLITLATGH